uniref:Uncharacterized protein n=1 Tax=Coccolithus braarudii TaxID=221442 RepID=A0A7S0LLP5_9EUKA|mmetsp:Transcript_47340/g.101058  ORF Transcript_47340/g.101058 Transcript_47340/m.101058 type:complete len:119 (+) Transcript_47340:336-692(+)
MACTYGALAGADPVPLDVAKLEALLGPIFTPAAQSEAHFAKMLQLVYNRAVVDLDVDEADLEGEEIAAQFLTSFRAATWQQSSMEIPPSEGVALLAELRCMIAAACGGPRGELRTANV